MPVRIRLARGGHKNYPFYRIVAANQRGKRDGKYLELLGSYCPLVDKLGCKHLKVNTDRFKYWVGIGASPSDTVVRLLSRFGLLPQPISPVNLLAKAAAVEARDPKLLQAVLQAPAPAKKGGAKKEAKGSA